ncbi:flagellar basal-body MS-ring/collar protein FliF [Sphingomonas sp. ac-8]|uniref:flagellar basal-body MS-ring/collar protein FliF n=1 Tax=Sphingomonas sp. ac-8 TaxID=3242977 RepID=UPI003A806C35
MIMGGVAAALLLAMSALALRGGSSEMAFLYTDLDPSAAQSIVEKLKSQNVPFQLSADGTSILAPQDKLASLRMDLAGEKLGGKIGYDVLDEEEPFGVSASRAKMNETRAIEGELARSIQSLDGVRSARVHLVMPERDMFATEARKATAGVTVKTSGRLPAEAVESIRYLVASSVPELAPEAVSIVDQTGALLARAGEAGQAGASGADERQAAVEGKMRDEIEALIEPIVGQGKVRAEVSAQIDRDQTREESDVYDPDKQVVAHQVTVESQDQNSENEAAAQGASVATQLPENQGQPAGAAGGNTRNTAQKQNSEDITYDNSRTHSVVLRAPGKITRLSVAVMVDGGAKGLPQAQVQRIQRLVENAVGIDAERGDSVVVESMAFAADDSLKDADSGFFSTITSGQIIGLLQLLAIGIFGLIALRMLKPKLAPAVPAPAEEILLNSQDPEMLALAEQAADGDVEALQRLEAMQQGHADVQLLDQEIALAQVDGRIKASALKRIGDAITASPPEAAAVIRQWMNA